MYLKWRSPIGIFFLFLPFLAIPCIQLNGLAMMPGDLGDARLNNYFLENIYQFVFGNSRSLWHLDFFSPLPFVIGFSDNLFGASPIYIFSRLLSAEPDTSFQIWFIVGYAANFSAAFYSLRRLGCGTCASFFGALLFSFALPTSAHAGHAQLHYRFGIPLSISFFILFLGQKSLRLLAISGWWLVLQFYCGIYIGFFAALMIVAITAVYVALNLCTTNASPMGVGHPFVDSWRNEGMARQSLFIGALVFQVAALILLFYPYIQASKIYGFHRSWAEIKTMLPTPQSYFLSDKNFLWGSYSKEIMIDLPMRHEHQMFLGVIPLFMALIGGFLGVHYSAKANNRLMLGMLAVVVFSTLSIGGFSIWYIFHKIPLASAIRVMSRLDQALLFPIAYFSAISIDFLITQKYRLSSGLVSLAFVLLIAEFFAVPILGSEKKIWRERLQSLARKVPLNLPEKSVLFFAQDSASEAYENELDAMWVALRHGRSTLNGYSGNLPRGYSQKFFDPCEELSKRIAAYSEFSIDIEGYLEDGELLKRVIPIGFSGCDFSVGEKSLVW